MERPRILKVWVAILGLLLVLPFIAFSVGSLSTGQTQVSGIDHFLDIKGIIGKSLVWTDPLSPSEWTVSGDLLGSALTLQNGTLSISGKFTAKPFPQAIQIMREVNLSLDDDPIVSISISLSKNVSFGIRFFGVLGNGTNLAAWHEDSPLQHIPGGGGPVVLQANLREESYLATGQTIFAGARITSLTVYVEERANHSADFQMTISKLEAFRYETSVSNRPFVSGLFQGIIVDLGPTRPGGQSLFQVLLGFEISGTPELRYIPFYATGLSLQAGGYTYTLKPAISYEFAVLVPSLLTASGNQVQRPTFYGGGDSIIILPLKGTITSFTIESISIRYTSLPPQLKGSLGSIQSRLSVAFVLELIFIVPIAILAILSRGGWHEDE